MKKYAFLAVAAAFLVPAPATYADTPAQEDSKMRFYLKNYEDFRGPMPEESFDLMGGERLIIKDGIVQKIEANGNAYYAPSSEYRAEDGSTVVVESGVIHHIEPPAKPMRLGFRDQ